LSASAFLHCFFYYFGISLNHLTSNAILHLSVFIHLCEDFIGIIPSISLFHLKPHPRSDSTSPLGGCGIQFLQGKKALFFIMILLILFGTGIPSGFILQT
jgi:hypothetical protein